MRENKTLKLILEYGGITGMVFLFGLIPKIIDFLQVGNNVFIGELIMFIYLLLYASLILYLVRPKGFRLRIIDFDYINIKDIKPSMELPKFMNIELAYFIGAHVWIVQDERIIIQTYILKWIQDGNLVQVKDANNPNKLVLIVKKELQSKNRNEIELFNFIKEMANNENVITNNSMEAWIVQNRKRMQEWFKYLYSSFYYKVSKETDTRIYHNRYSETKDYELNAGESLVNYAKQLMALKKWLEDYSVIDERHPIEVKLWNEYMLYASLFGIADKAEKKLEKVCPEIITYNRWEDFELLKEIEIAFKRVKVNVKKMLKVE